MIQQYVVDAFADRVFEGNPAAVCMLDRWPSEELLQAITRENGLPETAFVVPEGDSWRMRWLSQHGEINLCGHATMAAAYAMMRFVTPDSEELRYETLGGTLTVRKEGDLLSMDFPAYQLKRLEVTDAIEDALGARPREVWRARDLICLFDDPRTVVEMQPDQEKLLHVKGALMHVTAPGTGDYGMFDCVSRTFSPKMGLDEDPVCGSGHCHLVPFWAARLKKNELVACQASPRGGTLYCRMEGDRVILAGRAVLYSHSELFLDELL